MKTDSIKPSTAGMLGSTVLLVLVVIGCISLVKGQDAVVPNPGIRDLSSSEQAGNPAAEEAPRERLLNPLVEDDSDSTEQPSRRWPAPGSVWVTRFLTLKTMPAAEVIKTLRKLIDQKAAQLSVSDSGNTLIVTARPELLEAIQAVVERIDRPRPVDSADLPLGPIINPPVSGAPIGLPGPPVASRTATYGFYTATVSNPALAELESKYQQLNKQITDLVKKYREAKDERKQSGFREQIQGLTNEQFDLRQSGRELELKRLKTRLNDVESSVQKRASLKDKIVQRRVEDVLNGPHALHWESGPSIPGQPGFPVPQLPQLTPPAGNQNPYRSSLSPPGGVSATYGPQTLPPGTSANPKKTVLRRVPRYVTELVVGPDGQTRQQTRTIEAFESVELSDGPASPGEAGWRPGNSGDPGFADSTPDRARTYAKIVSGTTVAETAARFRIIQRKLLTGNQLSEAERVRLAGELQLAKLQLEQAKRSHEATGRLIDLELQRAESGLHVAQAELDEVKAVNKEIPSSVPPAAVRRKEAAVDQARIAVEAARTWLELHRGSAEMVDIEPDDDQPETFQPPAKEPSLKPSLNRDPNDDVGR